eukprot:CAMPEP_0184308956 /NCGR_PEP_ID=MMETSP1049-20130417/17272_1 /TAXON_ID=77928 /ORGANISM="Proteomonas sulcata, Strain CCMP704" /LENGTH=207 /DNA_ID=CAMNT_0026621745 /DNA_START=45 /DNA_END=668 /DNA_ORIENTATION=+
MTSSRVRLPKKSPVKFDLEAVKKRKNSGIMIRQESEGQRPEQRTIAKRRSLIFDIQGDELMGSKKVFLELRELWRGQIFGELGIINKSVRTANVVTKGPVEVLVMSKIHFWKFGLDSGDGAASLSRATQSYGYCTDLELMSNMMEDEFNWTNFRQDMAMDSIFGSNFTDRNTYGRFHTDSRETEDKKHAEDERKQESPKLLDPSAKG